MSADHKPPFWLVWKRGGRTPVYEHDSYLSARREAERLSRLNPGSAIYVMAPCARGFTGDQIFWSHCSPSGTPFDEDDHAPPTEEA